MDKLKDYFKKCYDRYIELIHDSKIDKELTAYYQGKLDFIIFVCQRFGINGICDNVD